MIDQESKILPTVPRFKTIKGLMKFIDNPIQILQDYGDEYGETFGYYIGGKDFVISSSDPAFNRHILQGNHRNYEKSALQTDLLSKYVGFGLLTTNGDYWLRQRRMIQPGFHRAKLQALSEVMVKVMNNFITDMAVSKNGDSFDIVADDKMMELAFKMVAKSLFTTSANEDTMNELAQHITTLQQFVVREIRQPFLHFWFQVSGIEKKHLDLAKKTNNIILDIIRERKESDAQFDDLLDMLISARYEDTGEGMTDEQLLYESFILFMAGHETTANALTWILFELTQHPEIVEKIRQETEAVLGDRDPGFEDFKQLSYTAQVINEGMRKYPPAWVTDRVAIEDDEFNGISIPKGTVVMPYIYGAHHSKKYWDKPSEFNPDRFSKDKKKEQVPFSFFPFGGGPRLCIGNSFAMMEMQIVLCQLLRKYDLTLVPGQEIEIKPLITLRPKEPISIRLTLR